MFRLILKQVLGFSNKNNCLKLHCYDTDYTNLNKLLELLTLVLGTLRATIK